MKELNVLHLSRTSLSHCNFRSPDSLVLENIFGFIFNITRNMRMCRVETPIKRRHWFAIREVGGNFYNLDSNLAEPSCIGGTKETMQFLTDHLDSPQSQLLIVLTRERVETSSWKVT